MEDKKDYFEKLDSYFVRNPLEFIKLIPKCSQFDSNQIRIIYKALYKATELHTGQTRKNGDPYITHPIAAASILARHGLDYVTVAAALLHDTIEDTSYTLSDCAEDFGVSVTKIVDGVTKLGRDVNYETHEKIIRSAIKEPKIIPVKGGDRLDNMRTLGALRPSKQIEIATETKNFYIPVTKITGVYLLKDEFQDLCLYYLDRPSFFEISNDRENLKEKYNKVLEEFGDKVQQILSKRLIAMDYTYRVKNVGGIYDDMKSLGINDIPDLLAVKMILDDSCLCYDALGVVHSISKPIQGSFNDFIATPKENGYMSLNTNVEFKGVNIQVRIRTRSMQESNNLGVFYDLNKFSDNMEKGLIKLLEKKGI